MSFFQKVNHSFRITPWYIYLLSVFFILFNLREIDYFASWKELWLPFLILVVAAFLICFLLQLIFRSVVKAGILTLLLLSIILFYSDVYFLINSPIEIKIQNRYIILFFLVLFAFAALRLFKTKKDPGRLNHYLNMLLVVLCLYELAWAGEFISRDKKWTDYVLAEDKLYDYQYAMPAFQTAPDRLDTIHPDVYLFIVDSYTSNGSLRKYLGYDNSFFTDSLDRLGFRTAANAHSNYAYTPLSLASLLNMDYLPPFNNEENAALRDALAMAMVNNSEVIQRFNEHRMSIRNLSLFRLSGIEKFFTYDHLALPDYTLFRNKLFNKTIFYWYAIRGNVQYAPEVIGQIADSAVSISKEVRNHPAFVYAHFPVPHGPFYFDRHGALLKDQPSDHKAAYLEQLQYTNSLVLHMVNEIKKNHNRKNVILVLGDHGSRFFDGMDNQAEDYTTLSSFYFPGADTLAIYDSVSHVNVFRKVFNLYFGKKLPMLKDEQEKWKGRSD